MNTNYRSLQLQSGQSLAVDRHGGATLFLTEGEVLLQAPAEWLGDTVVLQPSRRVAAPAALACAGIHSITAIRPAKFQLELAPGPLEKLGSALGRAFRPRRERSVQPYCAHPAGSGSRRAAC